MKEHQNMDFPDLEQYIREHWVPSENEEKYPKKEKSGELNSVKTLPDERADAKKRAD